MIYVAVNFCLTVDDGLGNEWKLWPGGDGVFHPIPANVYRRWRWCGELHRPLERMTLPSGATYRRCIVYARDAARGTPPRKWETVDVRTGRALKRPCGGG